VEIDCGNVDLLLLRVGGRTEGGGRRDTSEVGETRRRPWIGDRERMGEEGARWRMGG
jgi:hypothetical protein